MSKEIRRPVALIVLDGWGRNERRDERALAGDATRLARTPTHDRIRSTFPTSSLVTCGEDVGLPAGQMGNSEVGHMNLGAGRIVYQDLPRINKAVESDEFQRIEVFRELLNRVRSSGRTLHLMGLCSDGGVHSHLRHLYALLRMSAEIGVRNVLVHAFTDGRDTPPESGAGFLSEIQERIREIGVGRIATVMGRYYAMDRDRNWDRIERAYDAIVRGRGETGSDAAEIARSWYSKGKTDEFFPPTVVTGPDGSTHAMGDGDGVVFFNFRADRAREMTRALTDRDFDGFSRGDRPRVDLVTMTSYDGIFDLPVAFPPQTFTGTLGEVISTRGLGQLRIAETEKYAHVTYFFSCGREEPFPGEERCLVQSPRVATYDLKPEMSAREVCRRVVSFIREDKHALIVLNFANPDMVGHTGKLDAAIRAVETVDECLGDVLKALEERNGVALVTADHGNAEQMIDEDGGPHTAHTTNPVDLVCVDHQARDRALRSGILADVAPTVLAIMGIPAPPEMTGSSLI